MHPNTTIFLERSQRLQIQALGSMFATETCRKPVVEPSLGRDAPHGGNPSQPEVKRRTHMAAISFTPKHFLTSCTIMLSLPPSPVSSGKEMAGPGASSSATAAASLSLLARTTWWAGAAMLKER